MGCIAAAMVAAGLMLQVFMMKDWQKSACAKELSRIKQGA
jgi:hypothetical protein